MIYINLFIILIFIIFIHEFGHYFVARIFKTTVTDFSIGFGKVLYKFKDKNQTNWKISLIPLGGYVKIRGLESIFDSTKKIDESSDSFQSLSLIKKIFILLAGSFFNIFFAWLTLFFVLFFFGVINFLPIVGEVLEDSPAYNNDIKKGDLIVKINEKNIRYFNDISFAIQNQSLIKINIIRDNNLISKTFDLAFNEKLGKYFIGITSTDKPIINKYNLLISLKQSIIFVPTYYKESLNFLKLSYKNNTLSQELAGPIGIVKMADKLMLDKIKGVLFIFITISLFIAMFNLLPIPLLDGGHIVFFIIRSIFSNTLPSLVTRIYLVIGATFIGLLFLIITFNDIFYK
tara:strand:+ start:279 stop:1313 length:1035 start_codon:yes stop_codon:yes gene_type:complete